MLGNGGGLVGEVELSDVWIGHISLRNRTQIGDRVDDAICPSEIDNNSSSQWSAESFLATIKNDLSVAIAHQWARIERIDQHDIRPTEELGMGGREFGRTQAQRAKRGWGRSYGR